MYSLKNGRNVWNAQIKMYINYNFPTVLGLVYFQLHAWVHYRHTDVKACILFIYQTKVLNEVILDKIRDTINIMSWTYCKYAN